MIDVKEHSKSDRAEGAIAQAGATPIAFRTHLLVLLGYVVLTVLMTWPVAANLFTQLPGGGDAWHNVWNLWWVKRAALSGQWNVYHTDMLYFPEGVNLYFHTLALTAGLMALPLQLLGVNLLGSYNLVMLASFVLAGYGTFLLCNYLISISRFAIRYSQGAAFVGGLVFAFAPYHLAHMLGHLNLTMVQWIPFYVLLLLKAVDARGRNYDELRITNYELQRQDADSKVDQRPGVINHAPTEEGGTQPISNRLRRSGRAMTTNRQAALWYATGAGALLAVNIYTDLTYGIFLALLTGLLLLWKVGLPSERRSFRAAGVGWREGGVRLAVGLIVFFVLAGPVLVPTLAEAQKGYAQQSVDEATIYSSDVISAFTPSELHPLWGTLVASRVSKIGPYLPFKNSSERDVFLGYTVLALSGYAVWKLRKSRIVRFWALAALVTWVLSLGPVLQVFGRIRVPLIGGTFPMPYAILQHLPLFNIMRTPDRLTVLTMLALAILAAFGIVSWGGRQTDDRRRTIDEGQRIMDPGQMGTGYGSADLKPGKFATRNSQFAILPMALAGLILFEFIAVPFPTVPPGWNMPFYDKVAAEPGRFALLNLPERNLGDYMAFQTRHGKPIIGGFLARQPPYATLDNTPALRYLLDDTKPDNTLKGEVGGDKGVQALRDMGVKYIVMNWWLMSDTQKKDMELKLTVLLDTGNGRARDPDFSYPDYQVAVWQIMP